ncbi:MAG: methyltransferase [Desulfosarcinaceae bacterium]|nr:methyltransferase [Desulfosarcinaceae bacterium]
MTPSAPPWHPGTLLALSGSFWQTCALHAGVALDLFTHLANGSQTAAEVAAAADLSVDATARLLNALAALQLVETHGDRFTNTPAADQFLVATSPDYIGFMIRHHYHLVPGWSRLTEAVASGGPVRDRSSRNDPASREAFLMGMYNNSRLIAPRIAPAVDLSGCRRLLDLGGGPGTYAIFFCRHYPRLRATVFDLPTTRPFAEKVIGEHGLADRVQFQAGDFLQDALATDPLYDAVWMSHILHGEGPDDCRTLVAKAADALAPGGRLAIHEFILDDDRRGPLFATLFSLNMLIGTEKGRAYTDGELREMMTAAGLAQIERVAVDLPNESGILMGVKS